MNICEDLENEVQISKLNLFGLVYQNLKTSYKKNTQNAHGWLPVQVYSQLISLNIYLISLNIYL